MTEVAQGLRAALLGVAVAVALGILGELLLIGHTEEALQLVPLALAALALGGALWLRLAPGPAGLWALRGLGGTLALAAALGVVEHLEGNLAFEQEIRPGAAPSQALLAALAGANPLLAPGALVVLGAALAAATWRHPAGRDP